MADNNEEYIEANLVEVTPTSGFLVPKTWAESFIQYVHDLKEESDGG